MFRAILLASFVALGACAHDVQTVVPPELTRAPCLPASDLMAAPVDLPKAEPGQLMYQLLVRYKGAYISISERMKALQAFISDHCG